MRNPFIGLRPFQIADSGLFFGRARDVEILRNLILSAPVVVVYAPSGTGKSSLLNAGLLPVIERDSTLLPIVISDPHENVAHEVRRRLAATGWAAGKNAGGARLSEMFERYASDTGRRVILVVDQFEERLKKSERLEELYAEIARLANTRSDAATVIISIREDYLGGLEALMRRVTGLLDASYRVPNLSRDALVEAVHGPLKATGGDVTVDDRLIDEVLTDLEKQADPSESLDGRLLDNRVTNGHIEPGYFQIVWSHLWAKDAEKRELTLNTYEREDRATGILETFVSDTLSRLLSSEAEVLHAAIRYMVLPSGAKVAMMIEDLIGQFRRDDFTYYGFQLLTDGQPYDAQLSDDSQQTIKENLASLFDQLTTADAPLFRRVVRGGRVEFELIHDLLGRILVQWRLKYEPASAAQRTFRDVLIDVPAGYVGFSPLSRMASHKLHAIDGKLARYRQNLTTIETADEARANEEILRSAFSDIRDLAPVPGASVSVSSPEFFQTMSNVWKVLRSVALNHLSREVRAVLQREAYAFLTMRNGIRQEPTFSGSRLGTAERVAAGFAGLAVAVGGLYASYLLISLVWRVPRVQYLALTLSVIAVGAALLYLVAYNDHSDMSTSRGGVIVKTLWPVYDGASVSLGPPVTVGAFPEGASSVARGPALWRRIGGISVAVLMWWPVCYLVLELACFGGAAAFGGLGWSPTAGFNLAALIVAILLGGTFLVVHEL